MDKPLKDIGERGLLDALLPLLGRHTLGLPLGTGDDVAVTPESGSDRLAWTIDSMIEGTHFRWWPDPLATPQALGYKLVASNVSDLASKGARPLYALLSLGVPADESTQRIQDFYTGLDEAMQRFGARLIGGDTVRAPQWCLTLALVGSLGGDIPIAARHRARPGQTIYLAGFAGESAAGLDILEDRLAAAEPFRTQLVRSHLMPMVSADLGAALVAACPDLAMIDVSDGIVKDAGEIARASDCCIDIYTDYLRASGSLKSACDGDKALWQRYVLHGGEDYRLLFCTAGNIPADLRTRHAIHPIGAVAEGAGVCLVHDDGRREPVAPAGFSHFA